MEPAPADMPQPVLGALADSGVRTVAMVARCGPSQGRVEILDWAGLLGASGPGRA
ncbi:hypothetical protein [Streptomyces sp. NPDC041003]|uniref:hypothetical protein n=1 Tax=Streptomyces sp. NPDC041003 TaxID=3155730 RepID=UPI0033EDAFBF